MYIRKIAVVGSFAVSAALALAPLASADDELTPVVEIEISLLNSLFVSDAGLAGVPSSDYYTPVDAFDVIKSDGGTGDRTVYALRL